MILSVFMRFIKYSYNLYNLYNLHDSYNLHISYNLDTSCFKVNFRVYKN